jgi:hypothetical protein
MSAGASLVVTEPGADQISGRYEDSGCLSYPNILTCGNSFSLSMNEASPSSNYFKINIMNCKLQFEAFSKLILTLKKYTCQPRQHHDPW